VVTIGYTRKWRPRRAARRYRHSADTLLYTARHWQSDYCNSTHPTHAVRGGGTIMKSTNTLHSSTTTISNYRIINTVLLHIGRVSNQATELTLYLL